MACDDRRRTENARNNFAGNQTQNAGMQIGGARPARTS